jgi:hypothetical protein
MGVESVSWGAFAGKNFRGPILLCIREIWKGKHSMRTLSLVINLMRVKKT